MSVSLTSIFESLVLNHGPSDVVPASCRLDSTAWTFVLPRLSLRLNCAAGNITCELIDNNFDLPRKAIDPLRLDVRRIIHSANKGKLPKNGHALFAVIFQALEYLIDWETNFQIALDAPTLRSGWRADEKVDLDLLLSGRFGLDTSSVPDTAYAFLQRTPEQLCEHIPQAFRIVHVESIYRHDLAQRFESHRRKLRHSLVATPLEQLREAIPPHSEVASGRMLSTLKKEDIINDMCSSRVTYHGTPLKNVSSIVRNGFKLPGSRLQDGSQVASPRTSIVYNRGIYSSPSPAYALSYASPGRQPTALGELPAMRLFICATIMGRTLAARRAGSDPDVHGPLVDGYDSHFDSGFEYIVHHEAAILPCYVVHLDFGSEHAKATVREIQADPFAFEQRRETKTHAKLYKATLAPGDAKREAERKKAAAMKWFSNGFGSAKGTSFVIEEIGDVDDDEEEYGDWQDDRHGYFNETVGNYIALNEGALDADGGNIFDQYQLARRAKG